MIDYEFSRDRFVKHMTDFSMLDYNNQRGFERYAQFVFPYEYWPTRTAWHWAERAIAKPGAVEGAYNLYEMQQDWQEEVNQKYVAQIQEQLNSANLTDQQRADLEEKLKNANVIAGRMRKLVIPVPFLNDLTKAAGLEGVFNPEIAFDPYAAMFPIANWAIDYTDYSGEPNNIFGKAWQAVSQGPLSPNPIGKTVLSLAGVLPERDEAFDWMRRAGSPALIPLGFGGAGQAIYRWFSLGDEGPIAKLEDATGINVRDFFFENGYGAPGVLKYLASEITGSDPKDSKNWELYGTSRTLASLAAEDKRLVDLEAERRNRKAAGEDAGAVDADINERRQAISQEYVRAFYDQSGPIWDKAKKTYASVQGLKDLTSWLFGMGGVNVWQQGEVIQKGLEFIHNEVMATGDKDQREAFFDRYPEFTPRDIQNTVLEGPDAARDIAREQIYYWETELVNKKYNRRLEDYKSRIDQVQEQIANVEQQGLNLRVNREERSRLADIRDQLYAERDALYDERDKDYDQIDALYGTPVNSYAKNPVDRALREVSDEWYATYRIKDYDQAQAARDDILSRFRPANGANDALAWLTYGVQSAAIRDKARTDSFGKSNEDARLIKEQMERDIDELTQKSYVTLNAKDVTTALGLKEQGPMTPELAEYIQAINLYQSYKGIEELGLSKEEASKRKRDFWNANPLLEKYYGIESYHGSPEEAIQKTLQEWYSIFEDAPDEGDPGRQAYFQTNSKRIEQLRAILEPAGLIDPQNPNEVRLGQLWDAYYQLPQGSDARAQYLKENKAEIDRLNDLLGKDSMGGKSSADASREKQIWDRYYSLPKGDARKAYLMLVKDELNEIRARFGKEPLTNVGWVQENPRMSDNAPIEMSDLDKLFAGVQ